MNSINERESLAKQAQMNAARATGKCGTSLGLADDPQPSRPNLRERIDQQITQARMEAQHLDALGELQYLMEKHPEVARMLELMDKLGI